MRSDVSNFSAHVREFIQWRRRAGTAQRWERIEVVEVDLSLREHTYPDRPRTPADRFEDRWSQILAALDRDWNNLSGCGIQDGTLVLAVEWFNGAERPDTTDRAARISVNLSGDAGAYTWPWKA